MWKVVTYIQTPALTGQLSGTLVKNSARRYPPYPYHSTRRTFFLSSSFFRRTRVTREISPEEVRLYQEQQRARGNTARVNGFYSAQRPSSKRDEYGSNSSQFWAGYEMPTNENGLITPEDAVYEILKEPTIVIEREIEYMNIFLGFEQANKYKIMNSMGQQIGYMREQDYGIFRAIGRQISRLHRPFNIGVYDNYGNLVLTIKRPFSFINSHIKCYLPGYDESGNLMFEIIGETVQKWHLWRRRYNLFKMEDDATESYEQFGSVDSGFLAFDFPVRNEEGRVIASVDRNWVGLGRELFTDTGIYIIRMDPASFEGMGGEYATVPGPLSLDQRAILLGNAVSIDFDYFSRHSRSNGGAFRFGSGE